MVIDVLYNIALLLSLSVVYATLPLKGSHQSNNWYRFFTGVVIGLAGLLIMSRPFVLMQGVVFDSRSILIGVAGMLFGFLPTLISIIIMIIYRFISGGGGVVTGITVILTAFVIGCTWHHFRYQKFMENRTPLSIELYLVGVIIHGMMLLEMLLLPQVQSRQVFLSMTFPILLVYPLGFYLLAMLLFNQIQRIHIVNQLEISEHRFKTMFAQAPMGISVTNSQTGIAVEANQKFLNIIGLSREEFFRVDWKSITHPADIGEDERQMQLLLKNKIDSFSIDKRFIRPDGAIVWANMAVTILKSLQQDKKYHLCMITDITARKEMEEAIVYANTHDRLTNLSNRSYFETYLSNIDNGQQYPFAIVIGDINGLKVINDAFGHKEGDALLAHLAEQLNAMSEVKGIFCARIGGDEFGFILPQTEEREAWNFINDIQNKVNPIQVQNVELTLSFGVAVKHTATENLNEIIKQAENGMNRSKLSESPSSHSKAVHTIITTLHEKNPREELHSRRVSELASRLGEAHGLQVRELAELRTVGLLHDIGKIAIDESILNKEGPLNSIEWEAIKRHPATGWRILRSVGEFGELATFVLAHHERIDGKGYPRGLSEEEIPLQARIIAITDAYDAMTANRPYRAIVRDEEAAKELKRGAGTQFDAHLAQLFVEQVLKLPW